VVAYLSGIVTINDLYVSQGNTDLLHAVKYLSVVYQKTVTLDSFTSAYEVCKEMLRHLGLLEHSGIFGLYEVQGNLGICTWYVGIIIFA